MAIFCKLDLVFWRPVEANMEEAELFASKELASQQKYGLYLKSAVW